MVLDSSRLIAHTVVISYAVSPCGSVIIFGTSSRQLLVYSVASFFLDSDSYFEIHPKDVIHLEGLRSWHSLCMTTEFLLCGSGELIWLFRWTTTEKVCIKQIETTRLPLTEELQDREITCLHCSPKEQLLFAGTTGGTGHIYKISNGLVFLKKFVLHSSLIHAVCSAGPSEFGSCSEDGFVSFWDIRTLVTPDHSDGSARAVQSFYPGKVDCLARSELGNWLTALASESQDKDWFAVGGGPRLSIWNRRAATHLSTLHPDGSSAWTSGSWYAQTCMFHCSSTPSLRGESQLLPARIIAGGNASQLYSWDYGGRLLACLPLGEPARARITHTMQVVGPLSHPDAAAEDRQVMLVAGSGPAVRVISPALGYSLGVLALA